MSGPRSATRALLLLLAFVGVGCAAAEPSRGVPVTVRDTSTRPCRLDDDAWMAARATVFRVTPDREFEVEERWFGEGHERDDRLIAERIEAEPRVLVDGHADPVGDAGEMPLGHVLVLSRDWDRYPDIANTGHDETALLVYGRVFTRVCDRLGSHGVYESGRACDVRARILHVHALRRAFDEMCDAPRLDLLETLVNSRVHWAEVEALHVLARFGDDAVPILEDVLAKESQRHLHERAIAALVRIGTPRARSLIVAYIDLESSTDPGAERDAIEAALNQMYKR